MKTLSIVAITAFTFLALANFASAQGAFQVRSTTFMNGDILPLTAIFTRIRFNPKTMTPGNDCEPSWVDPGGDQSPQLSWTNVPTGTVSFAVVMRDITAGYTHWAMYNIPSTITSLRENAGAADSMIARQARNGVFARPLGYTGPCPPRDGSTHDYRFRVYALGQTLDLPPNPTDSQLLDALDTAAAAGKELARAEIIGRWTSCTGETTTSPPCNE